MFGVQRLGGIKILWGELPPNAPVAAGLLRKQMKALNHFTKHLLIFTTFCLSA